jgi:hypothetical protein
MSPRHAALVIVMAFAAGPAAAQSVCLPLPRLLTIVPPGGQAGTTVDVTIGGEGLEEVERLVFSSPGIGAEARHDAEGKPIPGGYRVTIGADVAEGVYEAAALAGLGISSSRVFSVGTLPEQTATAPVTDPATALPIALGSVTNGQVTAQAVDHYSFSAPAGTRIVVECAARWIDSRLTPVVVVADAGGRDLAADRRGEPLAFTVPADGRYLVKVHDLSFQGGPAFFYRLVLRAVAADAPVPRHPATRPVLACSWPPAGAAAAAAAEETEPNDPGHPQAITLPCDLHGQFATAADVEAFEFDATVGDEWWVEVASERLGRPTDPAVVVQRRVDDPAGVRWEDVAEPADIASPIKPSSNGYSYDGPPYDGGSADVLGKVAITTTGRHRLLLRDLFGGTRADPANAWRLIVRRPAPDFALVAWGLHMELRNGDRAALSKPLALRRGGSVALEVAALRRDGFTGPIDLALEGLPAGVEATGLRIPEGASRGLVVVSATADAPRGMATAALVGRATIGGAAVERRGAVASMAWPVRDASQEIPLPRLLATLPVSVGGAETFPITVTAEPVAVVAGTSVEVPLAVERRGPFSGATTRLRVVGAPFDRAADVELPLAAGDARLTLDLKKLAVPPGDYTICLVGGGVTSYRPATPVAKGPGSATVPPQDIAEIIVSRPIRIQVAAPPPEGSTP